MKHRHAMILCLSGLAGCLLAPGRKRETVFDGQHEYTYEQFNAGRIDAGIAEREKALREQDFTRDILFTTDFLWEKLESRSDERDKRLDDADRAKLKLRLRDYETKLAAAVGVSPRAGDPDVGSVGGRKKAPLSPEVREMLTQAIHDCDDAKLDLVHRHDPAAFTYVEDYPLGDVWMSVAKCARNKREQHHASDEARLDQEDEFNVKVAPESTKRGCGVHAVFFAGEHLGGGAFSRFSWTTAKRAFEERILSWSLEQPLACAKFPRPTAIPAEYQAAVDEYIRDQGTRDAIFVFQPPDENRQVRYVRVSVYSRNFEIPDGKNPCGPDKDVACALAGSPAVTAFDKTDHYLKRAEIHRAAHRADRCVTNLKAAQKAFEEYKTYRADKERQGTWVPNQRYKPALAPRPLSDREFTDAFVAKGRMIDEQLISGYCSAK